MNKRHLIPLFTAFVLWGSQYVVSKVALRTIPPVTLLALRYLVSIPGLLLVLRLRWALKPVDRRDWPILFAIGFTGYFASFCLQMLGIDRLTGSLSSLLGAMNPIFIPILAALFLHERITLSKIACVALSMLGVVVIVGVGGTADAAGVLMMLVSVFLCSTASIIIRRISSRYDPMQIALQNFAAIISTGVQSERLDEILSHELQTGEDALSNNGYDIEFDHVKFAYANDESILSDVSFRAKQGEVTALIGPSGGGKTTVSRLAARFWDIDSGSITVGGMDISRIDPETLLSMYSIVFQDVTLFNTTVLENIRLGKKDATDEEVIRAAKMANCEEFISRLPNGYQTQIGENGCNLSGGERQRISIARAFLKDAPIILLDEATASLDVENETLIQEALSGLIKDKTVLIIAHRMRTIANANHIVVLKDGVVAESGTPDELMAQDGIYRHMTELQNISRSWKIA